MPEWLAKSSTLKSYHLSVQWPFSARFLRMVWAGWTASALGNYFSDTGIMLTLVSYVLFPVSPGRRSFVGI